MLVLSRENNKGVVIGNNIVVTVVKIVSDKEVCLRVDVPAGMPACAQEDFVPADTEPENPE